VLRPNRRMLIQTLALVIKTGNLSFPFFCISTTILQISRRSSSRDNTPYGASLDGRICGCIFATCTAASVASFELEKEVSSKIFLRSANPFSTPDKNL